MVTVNDYIKKCNFVAAGMLDEQERIVLANETKIVRLNSEAFTAGLGSDGNLLINSSKSPVFSGRYTLFTQILNPRKIAGTLYDFMETGDFLSNMQLKIQPSLTKFDIYSTGTGGGDKSIFFSSYTNLFGLDPFNTDVLNYEIIYPTLMLYIKKYL